MKQLSIYINESLSNEISELRNKIKNLDKEKIFDGNYNLDDSLPEEFYEILISLNKPNSADSTLIKTWRMLFSKLIVEPLVGELIGDKDCEYSSIKVDRTEKWDIKYKSKTLIDVKASYNSRTHNFGIPQSDVDFIINYNKSDIGKRYLLFVYPEIKTWNDAIDLYKNKSKVDMKMISYSDLKDVLNNNDFDIIKNTVLIPDTFVNESDKFRKFKK
jgi:hypothetical protein